MDDKQKKRVRAWKPAVSYDKSREAPLDPDELAANGFIPALRFVGKGDTLESVAREVQDPALGEFDWRRLAHYNWGTTKREEINWYLLRDCQGSLAPTKSGLNVMFVDDATTHMPGASVWVPHRVDPPMQRPIPVARVDDDVNKAPTVTDTMFCPFLNVAEGTCRVAKLQEKAMKCWPPSRPVRDVPAFDLVKFNSEKAKEALEKAKKQKDGERAKKDGEKAKKDGETAAPALDGVELQSSSTFTISLNTWTIQRLPPVGTAVMTLTEFHVDLQAHQSVGVRDDAPATGTAGQSAGAGAASGRDDPATELAMGRLAHSIGILIDAGQLQRVVMRGYEDRSKPRRMLERARNARDRAEDVLERLQQGHHLPLYDEAIRGDFPGAVPVALVGGGAGDAPAGEASPSHDVVLVDLQAGPVSPAQVYELQEVSAWLFVEIKDPKNPKNDCSMLYSQGTSTSTGNGDGDGKSDGKSDSGGAGWCETPLDVARAREAAAAYGRILLSFGGENAGVGRRILEKIHRWSMVNKEGLKPFEGMLTKRVIEKGNVQDNVVDWASDCSLFKLGDPAAPPNHRRTGELSQVTASFDSLREITAALWQADRYVQLAHRIPV